MAIGGSSRIAGGRRRVASLACVAVATVSVAGVCGSRGAAPTPTPGHTPISIERPSTPPAVTPTSVPLKTVPAPIVHLELITRESAPPQYAVRITSGLPDGCTRFKDARIAGRGGTAITITVTNMHPADPMIVCTAIYGEHDEVVELGSDFARGTQYNVRVNDQELRFTAQ
jgi:hypothetical protein